MKRYILSSEDLEQKFNKNRQYNLSQTEVGHPLKTLKGSTIKRSKYGVGKLIGGQLYIHANYLNSLRLLDADEEYYSLLDQMEFELEPPFEWNCIRYDFNKKILACVEAPDFNTAREPVVGRIFTIHRDGTTTLSRFYNQIWHHKWLWVTNDYSGFDVAESWEWSKEWLSVLTEPANGSNQQNWISQLKRFGLD